MADFLNIPFDLNSIAQMGASNAAGLWVNIAISMVLSTVVGGILLIVVLGFFNRIYGEMLDYKRAFLVVLIVNILNFVGVVGILSPYISVVPYIGLILPLVIWIVLLKVFFEDMSFLHAIVVGAVFFAMTIIAIPYLVAIAASYIGF
jgi:hypothetical protein